MKVAHLDDIAIGGNASTVASDFEQLESLALQRGLKLNRAKCEIIGHTEDSRQAFTARGIVLPESEVEATTMLGAPLFRGAHLNNVLAEKRIELERLSKRLVDASARFSFSSTLCFVNASTLVHVAHCTVHRQPRALLL